MLLLPLLAGLVALRGPRIPLDDTVRAEPELDCPYYDRRLGDLAPSVAGVNGVSTSAHHAPFVSCRAAVRVEARFRVPAILPPDALLEQPEPSSVEAALAALRGPGMPRLASRVLAKLPPAALEQPEPASVPATSALGLEALARFVLAPPPSTDRRGWALGLELLGGTSRRSAAVVLTRSSNWRCCSAGSC